LLFGHFRSVPAQTTKDSPDHQIMKVSKGTIKSWVIFFDPEAADQLHVRIEYGGFKIMPYGELDAIVGFFSSSPIIDNIKLDIMPYELHIYAWNDDDSYPHEYYIHPIIVRSDPVSPLELSIEEMEDLESLLGGEA